MLCVLPLDLFLDESAIMTIVQFYSTRTQQQPTAVTLGAVCKHTIAGKEYEVKLLQYTSTVEQ